MRRKVMRRKVRIKKNYDKYEDIYSDLTGEIVYEGSAYEVVLDRKSIDILLLRNRERGTTFIATPNISKKNIIFLKSFQIE